MIACLQGIEESDIVYSNIVLETAWDGVTTYTVGDERRVDNKVYKSTATLNLNKKPGTIEGSKSWNYWKPSNALALVDLFSDTTTEWAADGIFEFKRGIKDTLAIGNFICENIKIEYKDYLGVVLLTKNYAVPRRIVWNDWDIIYAPFNFGTQFRVIYEPIEKIGYSIRVTLENNGEPTSCGYLVAGIGIYMGGTLTDVNRDTEIAGSTYLNVLNLSTWVYDYLQDQTIAKGQSMYNTPCLIVVDESPTSIHSDMTMVGTIKQCTGAATGFDKEQINFRIIENKEYV